MTIWSHITMYVGSEGQKTFKDSFKNYIGSEGISARSGCGVGWLVQMVKVELSNYQVVNRGGVLQSVHMRLPVSLPVRVCAILRPAGFIILHFCDLCNLMFTKLSLGFVSACSFKLIICTMCIKQSKNISTFAQTFNFQYVESPLVISCWSQ